MGVRSTRASALLPESEHDERQENGGENTALRGLAARRRAFRARREEREGPKAGSSPAGIEKPPVQARSGACWSSRGEVDLQRATGTSRKRGAVARASLALSRGEEAAGSRGSPFPAPGWCYGDGAGGMAAASDEEGAAHCSRTAAEILDGDVEPSVLRSWCLQQR